MKPFKYWILLPLLYGWTLLSVNAQNALDFDGVDDIVTTSYQGILGGAPRTVEAWVKTTANCNPSAGGVQQIIVDWGTFVTGGRFTFCLLWNNSVRLEVGGNGISGTTAVNDGNWHHIAGVYDPTATNRVSLYVDGVLDAAGNFTVTTNTVAGTNVQIGRRVDNARNFDGAIDDVRIWSTARTGTQIANNRNSEICATTSGLEAYYNFNTGVAGATNTGINTLRDFSGNNRNGTLTNFSLAGASSNWVAGATLTPGLSTTDISQAACDSFFWSADSVTYTASGNYSATLSSFLGCDSIVNLDLTLNSSTQSVDTVTICDQYFWSVSGSTYVQSGMYMETLTTAAGCDSTVTLDLTIFDSDTITETITQCDAYFWPADSTTYTVSGNYAAMLTNAQGCDSLAQLNLTIQTVDTSVTNNGVGGLTANLAGATYQWVVCPSLQAIPGATAQTFVPAQNGTFALIITSGGCTDTSGCQYIIVVNQDDTQPENAVRISPNPNQGRFQLEMANMQATVTVAIANAFGQTLFQRAYHNTRHEEIEAGLAAGVYFVRVATSTGGVKVLRMVVGE